MKKGLTVLTVVLALTTAACGASIEEQQKAKDDADKRGFSTTAMSTDGTNGDIFIEVSFGEKGCVGRITYHGGEGYRNMTLHIDMPTPGTTDEVTDMKIDDPRVNNLRNLPPLSELCFTKE